MVRFAVLEGLDGSGKSTQIELLRKYFQANSIKHKYLHFPRLEKGVFGELIARFLRGEMGSIDEVNPYLLALLFAGDRMDAKKQIEQWIADGYLVLVDRYVYSNIAFQCAKLTGIEEQKALADWILNLEYTHNALPKPDINLFLDVPFSFTKARLSTRRKGRDRNYLKGNEDIHEQDLDFQSRVSSIYKDICVAYGNLELINCADPSGKMIDPDKIFGIILKHLKLSSNQYD